MHFSFILTTYQVAPYVGRCLSSLINVLRPGDELIVIDDGSQDETPLEIHRFFSSYTPSDEVVIKHINLGVNTPGGVGIAANIGLDAASRDTIFFVDGDDWLNSEGFEVARANWSLNDYDILFGNYLVFDELNREMSHPTDLHLWGQTNSGMSLHDLRLKALGFISVPWRKFYRRAFLETNRLRFPEGDFFFEDNPFHWSVCRKAEKIGFVDRILCYHRINRPGQTMASSGIELAAFFVHFGTIWSNLQEADHSLKLQAIYWLCENISWHLERLTPQARVQYALAGSKALSLIDAKTWERFLTVQISETPALTLMRRLREGNIEAQIMHWEAQDIALKLEKLDKQNDDLRTELTDVRRKIQAQSATQTFSSIRGSS